MSDLLYRERRIAARNVMMCDNDRTGILSSFLRCLTDIIRDQRGISSVEYSTLTGMVSGMTWMIGGVINDAALESARRTALLVNP